MSKPALSIKNQRKFYEESNPFLMFVGRFGVSMAHKRDITGEGRGRMSNRLIPSYPPIFRRDGLPLDELAEMAVQHGFINQNKIDDDATGAVDLVSEMIKKLFLGFPIYKVDHFDLMNGILQQYEES